MTEAADNLFVELWESSQEERERRLGECELAVRAEVRAMFDEHEKFKQSNWLASPISLSKDLSETHTYEDGDTRRHRPKRDRGYRDTDPPARIGRYETKRVLGRGGFAVVCLAWDPYFEQNVAVKLTLDPVTDEQMREHFMEEARQLERLQHDHIVKVRDVGCTDDNHIFIVMEYIQGGSLHRYLKDHADLSMKQIAEILAPIADAVAHIHQKGNQVIHRDIKPANILLSGDPPSPKLADFGLAVRDDELDAHAGGTWDYMSPDQIKHWSDASNELPDVTSDVWALGVMLCEMLIGERPFKGRREVLEKPIPWPRQLCPQRNIPEELEALCRDCLVRDRDKRKIGASDVANRLRTFLASIEERSHPEPVAAPVPLTETKKDSQEDKGGKWRVRVLVLLVISILLASVALGGIWMFGRSRRPVDRFVEPGDTISILYRKPKLRSTHGSPPKLSQPKRGGPITAVSSDRMLVELDETELDRFELELSFQKSNWSGDFGVYWGYRPIVFQERKCFIANAIIFACATNAQGDPIVNATRHRFRFFPLTEGGYNMHDIAPREKPFSFKRRLLTAGGVARINIEADASVTLKWLGIRVPCGMGDFGEHRGAFGFINTQGDTVLVRGDFLIPISAEKP